MYAWERWRVCEGQRASLCSLFSLFILLGLLGIKFRLPGRLTRAFKWMCWSTAFLFDTPVLQVCQAGHRAYGVLFSQKNFEIHIISKHQQNWDLLKPGHVYLRNSPSEPASGHVLTFNTFDCQPLLRVVSLLVSEELRVEGDYVIISFLT